MRLGHLLTRSCLTYPEVSSKAYHKSFCQLDICVSLNLGNLFRSILFTCCIQLLLYSSNLSKIGVIFTTFAIYAFVSNLSQVYPAVLFIYFMQLGHLLTRSCLTYPEAYSKVYHDSFCPSDSSVSLHCVIYFEAFYLHVVELGSSVGIVTDYRLDGSGTNPGGYEIFRQSRPVLGPTQTPLQ